MATGVRRDVLCVDKGVLGARASRPNLDRALDSLETGDTSSSRLWTDWADPHRTGLPSPNNFRGRGAGLRVLNLSGDDVDTATPMGCMLPTVMAALGHTKHEIKREQVNER